MASQGTKLPIVTRTAEGSRSTRRLRRTGRVPGVLYGGELAPLAFSVDARELRHALARRGAVLEVGLDGATQPAVLKSAHYHPVRGETIHIDLLRVNLSVAIHAVVPLELSGAEEAPGTKEGGVLEHVTRELNVEALPTDVPENIVIDVSGMEAAATMHLSEIEAPEGVEFLDDPDDTIIATVTVPSEVVEEPDIEEETELVGEGEAAEGAAEGGDQPEGGAEES